jgi:hypothetical protein
MGAMPPFKKLGSNMFSTPKAPGNIGQKIGQTKTGKDVMSHTKPGAYKGFEPADHNDAMNAHYSHYMDSKDPKKSAHHLNMAKWHMQARDRGEKMLGKSGAPGTLVGSNALEVEHIARIKKMARESYALSKNKSDLENMISTKHPTLGKAEVIAVAKMVLYRLTKEEEKKLEKIYKKIKA